VNELDLLTEALNRTDPAQRAAFLAKAFWHLRENTATIRVLRRFVRISIWLVTLSPRNESLRCRCLDSDFAVTIQSAGWSSQEELEPETGRRGWNGRDHWLACLAYVGLDTFVPATGRTPRSRGSTRSDDESWRFSRRLSRKQEPTLAVSMVTCSFQVKWHRLGSGSLPNDGRSIVTDETGMSHG
jgi:hypothetical protein